MKKTKILFALMPLATTVTIPAVMLTSCNSNSTYTITYGSTPTGLTFSSKPTSTKAKTAVSITYTLATNYSIDESSCTVTCNGTDITSNCSFGATSTTIPSSSVSGNLVVTLATKTTQPTVDTYTVTYNTPTGLSWNTIVTNVAKGSSLYMEYTLDNGYAINTSECYITVGGSPVINKITWKNGKISIPANLLTGDVVIYLQLSAAKSYTVKYSSDTHITWSSSKPATCVSGTTFEVDYSLTSGYAISSDSTITCGENGESNITYYCTFNNGTVIVPGDKITGVLNINLSTITETTPSPTWTEPTGGSISSKTSSTTGNTVYTLKATDETSNEPMNITLSGTWLKSALQIKSAGTYNITLLDGFKLSNAASYEAAGSEAEAPIEITKDAIVNIIVPNSAEATINDLRTGELTDDSKDFVIRHKGEGGQLNFIGDAAGGGVLNINNRTNNIGWTTKAIQTKCNMTISGGVTINAFAYDTCIQCGGLLTIDNANVIADSYTDDGIKNKTLDPDEDLAAAGTNGNNTRDIIIKGKSNVTVYADKTGINATHNFITQSDDNGTPTINVYTNTEAKAVNSATVKGTTVADEQNMFIEVPSSLITTYGIEDYFYTIVFYSDNEGSNPSDPEYMTLKKIATTTQGQTSSTNYFFKCDRPLSSDAAYFKINLYAKNQYGASSMTATASSDYIKTVDSPAIANTKDCVAITGISSSISTSKAYLDRNYKATEKGEQEEEIDTTVSSKGIKAKNNISLPAGDITIKSVDTCISASYGDIFCNSTTAGDISFGAGTIQLSGAAISGSSTSNDGVKAYGQLDISAGSLNISNSVEALEAPIINVSGGKTVLYATDDGINASTSGKYVTNQLGFNMSGGILDIQTNGDDTDCIDSNNTITITGGLLVARVPANGGSMTLDWETDNVSVTGTATVVLLGKTEADGMNPEPPQPTTRTISTTGTDYTSSIKTATVCSATSHTIQYYSTASTSSSDSYTFTNRFQANSSKVRVWSCTGTVTIS